MKFPNPAPPPPPRPVRVFGCGRRAKAIWKADPRRSGKAHFALFGDFLLIGSDYGLGLWVVRLVGFTHRPHSSSFWGSYLEFYKVIPKRNYYGAYG